MGERADGLLAGMRVLVVEDEHLVALALADDLEDAGAIVVGPASSVENALHLIEHHQLEAAVLDIKLQSQFVFPVARALDGRGVPFLFTTGYDASVVPDEYAHVPKCEKPASMSTITKMLATLTGRNE